MANLGKRISALENYIADTTPEPAHVLISNDPAEIAAYNALHKEPKLVIITTVCARKCSDDCTGRGGHYCRHAQEVTL